MNDRRVGDHDADPPELAHLRHPGRGDGLAGRGDVGAVHQHGGPACEAGELRGQEVRHVGRLRGRGSLDGRRGGATGTEGGRDSEDARRAGEAGRESHWSLPRGCGGV